MLDEVPAKSHDMTLLLVVASQFSSLALRAIVSIVCVHIENACWLSFDMISLLFLYRHEMCGSVITFQTSWKLFTDVQASRHIDHCSICGITGISHILPPLAYTRRRWRSCTFQSSFSFCFLSTDPSAVLLPSISFVTSLSIISITSIRWSALLPVTFTYTPLRPLSSFTTALAICCFNCARSVQRFLISWLDLLELAMMKPSWVFHPGGVKDDE